MSRGPIENMARIVALLQVKDRSYPELSRTLGLDRNNVRRHCRALAAESLVELSIGPVRELGGRPPVLVKWRKTI